MNPISAIASAVGDIVSAGFRFGESRQNKMIAELQVKAQQAQNDHEREMYMRQIERIQAGQVNLFATDNTLLYIGLTLIVIIILSLIFFTKR